jgi:DNA-binding NarL/FixJ family response regulator
MIGVFLVDDHRLFREAMRLVLSADDGIEVVGEAGAAAEAVRLVAATPCNLVLVDVALPGDDGLWLVRELKRADRVRKVVVLTMFQHPDMVTDALAAGADGYALKKQPPEEVLEAVHVVMGGNRYVTPSLASALPASGGRRAAPGALGVLSGREREIFDHLVRGDSNGDVGHKLGISIKTVETHRSRLMRKLDVHSIGELIRLAARQGHLGD